MTKSYEYKGYRIYDNGYGFDIYKNTFATSIQIASNFDSSDECEEYIDNILNTNDNPKVIDKYVYLIVMLDGDKLGYPRKILHYINNRLKWFSSQDTSYNSQKTMIKFYDLDACKNFLNRRYSSSKQTQYGIIKSKLSDGIIKFSNGDKLVYYQKVSMK